MTSGQLISQLISAALFCVPCQSCLTLQPSPVQIVASALAAKLQRVASNCQQALSPGGHPSRDFLGPGGQVRCSLVSSKWQGRVACTPPLRQCGPQQARARGLLSRSSKVSLHSTNVVTTSLNERSANTVTTKLEQANERRVASLVVIFLTFLVLDGKHVDCRGFESGIEEWLASIHAVTTRLEPVVSSPDPPRQAWLLLEK